MCPRKPDHDRTHRWSAGGVDDIERGRAPAGSRTRASRRTQAARARQTPLSRSASSSDDSGTGRSPDILPAKTDGSLRRISTRRDTFGTSDFTAS